MCGDMNIPASVRERIAAISATDLEVSMSPFGPDDEIGMLNLLDDVSAAEILGRVTGSPYDLAVDFFMGMPSWTAFGDPPFQIAMSHTPNGNVIDNVIGCGSTENELVSYSSDSISMYSHTGTHVDAFCHFGYHHKIWNGFSEAEHLGSRHWTRCGVDKHPPIITRGVLIDVAAQYGCEMLPAGFVIGPDELEQTLRAQGTEVRPGDVVLVRTGRMTVWPDTDAYIVDEPGLDRAGARYLCRRGAVIVGADTAALEVRPSQDPNNFHDVHTYLLAEAGVPILEIANLEDIAADKVYEFAFVGAALKVRGATGSPIRPVAMRLR